MENFTKLRIALILGLMVVGLTATFAQQLNSTGLYKHGTNSHSGGSEVTYELTDSVTVGAATDYYVMPDPLYNTAFNATNSLSAGIVSTFQWTSTFSLSAPAVAPSPGPAIATKAGFAENYVRVNWPASPSAYILNVIEKGGSCTDNGGGTNINVTVINKPTANFSSATLTECTATPATHSYELPLSLFTDMNHGKLIVDFTVVFTPASGSPTTTNYNNKVLSETVPLTLQSLIGSALAYGKYEVTITSVRDRVSVKSNVSGTIGSTPLFTYNLIRLPKTGAIYHLPNN